MEIKKAYRLRIYPNRSQEQRLLQTIGACRFVYNYYLDKRKNHYLACGETLKFADLSRDLTQLRKQTEWMDTVQIVPLQQSLRALDTAFNRFYRKQAGFPRFKTRRAARQSFRKTNGWSIQEDGLFLERGLTIRFRGTRPPAGMQMSTIAVTRTATGKWYASVTCEQLVGKPVELDSTALGIDLGLTHLAIASDGEKYENLSVHKRQLQALKTLQQSLSRKDSGSARYRKARLDVARLHEKISNRRMNHLHQVSSAITGKNHALIAVEDLAVANMLKNRHLSRAISDASWGELLRQLQYKQEWRGGRFEKVGRFFPSSKTCNECGYIVQSMPLGVREWDCARCGSHHDRDINAAINIKKQAEVQLGVESTDGSPLAGESYRLDEVRSVV